MAVLVDVGHEVGAESIAAARHATEVGDPSAAPVQARQPARPADIARDRDGVCRIRDVRGRVAREGYRRTDGVTPAEVRDLRGVAAAVDAGHDREGVVDRVQCDDGELVALEADDHVDVVARVDQGADTGDLVHLDRDAALWLGAQVVASGTLAAAGA